MKDTSPGQNEIRLWFDDQYRRRGLPYVRPRVAYYLYPKLLGVQQGKKILDVACGPGLLLSVAQEKGLEAYGMDISQKALELSKFVAPGAQVSAANAEILPYRDKIFDYVTCLGSLERFINLERSLSEQMRVAKDDALFCYLVRNAKTVTWKVIMQFLGMRNHRSHQEAKTIQEWKNIFIRSGFEIIHICHDHWPFLRLIRWMTLGGTFVDYGKIRRSLLPIQYASEFIFILKKTRCRNNRSVIHEDDIHERVGK